MSRVIDGQSADPATSIKAIFVCVVVDVDLIQKVDREPPENLDRALQLEGGKLVAVKTLHFQLHNGANLIDSRVEPVDQTLMERLGQNAIATEAVCKDDQPEASEFGIQHQAMVGCHDVISFILMTRIGHSLAKRGPGPQNVACKRGEPILTLAAKLGETAPSLTPDLRE